MTEHTGHTYTGVPLDSQFGIGPGSGSGVSKDSLEVESWMGGCWCHSLIEGPWRAGGSRAEVAKYVLCVSVCVSGSEVCVC